MKNPAKLKLFLIVSLILFSACGGGGGGGGASEPPPVPFEVLSITPNDGVTQSSISTTVDVTIDKAIDPNSITTTSNFTCAGTILISADNFNTCIPITAQTNGDDTVITLATVGKLPATSTIKARVTTGLLPVDGAALTSDWESLGFQTGATPAIEVVTGSLITTEAGGQISIGIRLVSKPLATVGIALLSDNEAEGTLDKSILDFTTANWSQIQNVTVTGVDDLIADGNQIYSFVILPAASADPDYNAFDAPDIFLGNMDDDSAGMIEGNPPLPVLFEDHSFTFTKEFRIQSQPLSDVTISAHSFDTTIATVSPSITFTPANWTQSQFITYTAVDNPWVHPTLAQVDIGIIYFTDDPTYTAGLVDYIETLTVIDNDTVGFTVTPISGNIAESGGTATFSIQMQGGRDQLNDVTISIDSSNPAEGVTDVNSITFTPANSDQPQIVTVTGVDDLLLDGDQTFSIITGKTVSLSPLFHNLVIDDVAVTSLDDEVMTMSVSALSSPTVSELGAESTFTIQLSVGPAQPFVVNISVDDAAEAFVYPNTITIDAANYNQPHLITVHGVSDQVQDGDKPVNVTVTPPAGSGFPDTILSLINREVSAPSFGTYAPGLLNDNFTDASGNKYVLTKPGTTLYGYKLDSANNIIWEKQLLDVSPAAVHVDAQGNIYVCSRTTGSVYAPNVGLTDIQVVKMDTDGNIIWGNQFGSTADEHCTGMGVDASGNVYLTGWLDYLSGGGPFNGQPRSSHYNRFLMKLDANGNDLWTKVRLNNNNYMDSFAVTPSGTFMGTSGNVLYIFDTNGVATKSTYITNSGLTRFVKTKFDPSGNIILVGVTGGSSIGFTLAGLEDAIIVKLDSAGVEQWHYQTGFSALYASTVFRNVFFDPTGNIYVVGSGKGNQVLADNIDLFTYPSLFMKFSPTGTPLLQQLVGVENPALTTSSKLEAGFWQNNTILFFGYGIFQLFTP